LVIVGWNTRQDEVPSGGEVLEKTLAFPTEVGHAPYRMTSLDKPFGKEGDLFALVPMKSEMESRIRSQVITYRDGNMIRAGGMCGCCGGGPDVEPSWRGDPWYVYKAGFCDRDGVYYSMLCEGCLEELRADNAGRPETERDKIARELTELLGDDIDGAQVMMDDLG
jgi:hypothetical protein